MATEPQFADIFTLSYHVLVDTTLRKGYDHLLEIRCLANQTLDLDMMVDPFMCFAVEKTSGGSSSRDDRLLKFDFFNRTLVLSVKLIVCQLFLFSLFFTPHLINNHC